MVWKVKIIETIFIALNYISQKKSHAPENGAERHKKVSLKAFTLAYSILFVILPKEFMSVNVWEILLGADGFVLGKYEGNEVKATEQNLETLLAFPNGQL